MLIATSLAKQPSFHQKVRSFSLPIYYFCGEKDEKFKKMAQENQQLNLFFVERYDCAHLENPIAFANKIVEIINRLKVRLFIA